MLEHNIHIGISSELVNPALFDSFVWHRGSICIVVGKNHRLADRSSIKLRELQGEIVIAFDDDTCSPNIVGKLCASKGIIPSFYLEGFELGLFNELCSTGKIAAFWAGPVDDKLAECVIIEIEDINLEWEASFIVQKSVYLNNAEKLFIEYAQKTLAKP
jgi:hypothetical protein